MADFLFAQADLNHLNATVRGTVAADGWTEANHNFAPAEQNANKSG